MSSWRNAGLRFGFERGKARFEEEILRLHKEARTTLLALRAQRKAADGAQCAVHLRADNSSYAARRLRYDLSGHMLPALRH